MARKSLTLVHVGPVSMRSPIRVKKPVESLSERKWAGSRPSKRARSRVVSSILAPAGSSAEPAPPSGPAAQPHTPGRAGERGGERQGVFLVRPAPALAGDGHGQFAARQDHGAA